MTVAGLEREIEAVIADRLGREALFAPSGRIALFLALTSWCPEGGRLLMSPLQDDAILFTVLAAGLRPVMAPVSTRDGNIDPDAVAVATWATLDGVLTTNLYGLPDRTLELRRRCEERGIPLIEDCAHAFGVELDGRPVGTVGSAAAFSLSKHPGAVGGGILCFDDDGRGEDLRRQCDRLRRPARFGDGLGGWLQPTVEQVLRGSRLVAPVRAAAGRVRRPARPGYRMVLDPGDLRDALRTAPSIEAFDRWMRVDLHRYRRRSSPTALRAMLAGIRRAHGQKAARIEGVRRLLDHPAVAAAVRDRPDQPYFRVPLLITKRDEVRSRLSTRLLGIGYIYDPPLDDYAGGEFVDPSPAPAPAQWWAAHVLPVDPLEAGPARLALADLGIEPAPVSLG